MRTHRTTFQAFAACAALSAALTIAGSTTAAAGGRLLPFCHSGLGAPSRAYIPPPVAPQPSRGAGNVTPVAKVAASRPRPEEMKPVHRAADPPPKPIAAVVAVAVRAAEQAPTCVTKEYLDTGAVMFKDTCSREWAVNSTTVGRKVAAAPSCLTKETSRNGVVMFRDVCTSEWAMNTIDQPSSEPAQ